MRRVLLLIARFMGNIQFVPHMVSKPDQMSKMINNK